MSTGITDESWAGFDEVASANEIEIGSELAKEAAKAEEPKEEAPKAEEPEVEEPDDTEGDDQDDEDEGEEKPKKSHKDHQIERLKREKAEAKQKALEYEQRLAALEARLTPPENPVIPDVDTAPNAQDAEKYPLGTLDPRYIEDLANWKVEAVLRQRDAADLQRQQESKAQEALLTTLDSLVTKGTSFDADFREKVVETGFRGEWELGQATFEAAGEAENGARILYDLSQDPKEAARVAKLSPFGQAKYVAERDVEIAKGSKPRVTPQAGDPPKHNTRGANSRVKDNPATDDLDDFGRQFDQVK